MQRTLKKLIFLMFVITFFPGLSFSNKNTSTIVQQTQTSHDRNIKNRFIGTWKLVSNMKKDGELNIYPYGKDALGYITYAANGYMSVQIMQQHRKTSLPGYFAYFGRYAIDQNKKIIHHYLIGSLNPTEINTDRQRSYRFIGQQLLLTPVEETSREILWEKIN